MRVKVRGKWYDGTKEIVVLEYTQKDLRNLKNAPKSNTKYAMFPDDTKSEDIYNALEIPNPEKSKKVNKKVK